MMPPNTQDGGTASFRVGSLKRRLKPVTLAFISSSEGDSEFSLTSRLLLKNLSGDLNVQIACGFVGPDGRPLRPSQYPASPGTIQLTPINNFPEAQGKLYLRPVFQDPALAQNENHPLPQNIPFGWEFSTRADEVEIDVVLTDVWSETLLNGRCVLEVTIEYNGQWWDTEAIKFAVGQVTLTGGPTSASRMFTGVE